MIEFQNKHFKLKLNLVSFIYLAALMPM